jgi:hypothetical protein
VWTFGNGNGGSGGAGVDGAAWSYFYDVIAIGSTTCCKTDMTWVFYNSQHIYGEHMTAFDVNVGLNLISQGPQEPMNSVFSDIYTYTYPKSAANGNNSEPGLWLQDLTDGAGNTSGLAFVTILRPQVNSYNGDGTGYNVILNSVSAAAVENVSLIDLDAEGPQLDQVNLNYASHNYIRYQGYSGSPNGPTNTVELASNTGFNLLESLDNHAVAKIDSGGNNQNVFHGAWKSFTDPSASQRGLYNLNGSATWLYADSAWFAQGLSFGNYGSGNITSANTNSALIAGPAGTESAPTYSFNGDTGTGMYDVGGGSHEVAFAANGTAVFAFTPTVANYVGVQINTYDSTATYSVGIPAPNSSSSCTPCTGLTHASSGWSALSFVSGIATAGTASSDERLKNWQDYHRGLKEILGLDPIRSTGTPTHSASSTTNLPRMRISASALRTCGNTCPRRLE